MSGDNWIHRSSGMQCSTCIWHSEKLNKDNSSVGFGRCRRHAPTMAGYPAVFASDWCGDHKLDENSLACKSSQAGKGES